MENIKLDDFVTGYNKTTENLKSRYIKEKVDVKKYIGLGDKCNLAKRIIDASTYEIDIDGNKTNNIRINSVTRFLLSTLSLIQNYTNIDINFDDALGQYDLLNENGLIELFIGENGLIPEKEVVEFNTILNMTLDDTLQNTLSTQAFIQNQVTRFGTLIGVTLSPIMDKIADSINNMDEKTVDNMGKQLDKILKKM